MHPKIFTTHPPLIITTTYKQNTQHTKRKEKNHNNNNTETQTKIHEKGRRKKGCAERKAFPVIKQATVHSAGKARLD